MENHKNKMLMENHYNPININENADAEIMSNQMKVKSYGEPISFTNDLHNYDERGYADSINAYSLVPINVMPPPPHNLVNNINNNLMVHNYHRRESWKALDIRSNSPQSTESDESCMSYTSRDSPLDNSCNKNKVLRNTCSPFFNKSFLYGKYGTAEVYFSGGNHNNTGNLNKPRYYSNSAIRQRRESRKHQQPQDIYRRVYGLMERFTSKAKFLHIIPNPPHLLKRNSWDQLNQSIWDVYTTKAQKEETYLRKLGLWKNVYLNIRKILVRYGLFMVGSTMSGLGTEKSDIDMCLLVKPCLNDARTDALSYLQNIQIILSDCDFVKSTDLILAKVPILKFRGCQHGFEVDLNCNNAVGIRNTHLMHCYAHLDWRVRPLVVIVKLWAQANNINDAKKMTISSYSLALMVIHYLQCGVTPPAIPCLHGLYPEKFNANSEIHNIDIQEELPVFLSDNKDSLGELFLGFLRYFTFFDYDHFALSVREGTVLSKEECRYTRSQKNDVTQWKLLCIEEPFDLTNTARSVYDVDTFEHIKNVFHISYKALMETKNLSSIFPNVELNQR